MQNRLVEDGKQAHPLEVDMVTLKESRRKVLDIANYVIPGHGKMFKFEK